MKVKVIKRQKIGEDCVVCGYKNPFGLKAEFLELENQEVLTKFTMEDHHQSYPGRAHGGLIGAILDEVIGRAIKIVEDDCWAVTVELTVQYKKPVPLEVPLTAIGRIDTNRKRMFKGTGEIYLPTGEVAATATGTYVKLQPSKIADEDFDSLVWKEPEDLDLPEFVEIYLNQKAPQE